VLRWARSIPPVLRNGAGVASDPNTLTPAPILGNSSIGGQARLNINTAGSDIISGNQAVVAHGDGTEWSAQISGTGNSLAVNYNNPDTVTPRQLQRIGFRRPLPGDNLILDLFGLFHPEQQRGPFLHALGTVASRTQLLRFVRRRPPVCRCSRSAASSASSKTPESR